MSKYPGHRKSNFVIVLDQELLKSKAFLSLNGSAIQIYLLFLCKRKMLIEGRKGHQKKRCINSRELVFTYKEAFKKYGITSPRFTRSIDKLVEAGFIDIVKSGALLEEVTLYGLSERWKLFGTEGFKKVQRQKCLSTRGFIKPKENNKYGGSIECI